MPKLDGISAANVTPPREIKLQRANPPPAQSKPEADPSPPKDREAARRTEQASSTNEQNALSAPKPKPVESSFKARLNYDIENEDLYIEIISPRTGEVLQRLPPEDALDPLIQATDGKPGAVLDQVA